MKIAFDLRRIKNPGIGRYMKCLVEAILEEDPHGDYLLILPPGAEGVIRVNGSRARVITSSLKYYSFREQIGLPKILSHNKIDLLHAPHFMLPLIRPCSSVVTIHDVIGLAWKADLGSWTGQLYYRCMMSAVVRLANQIITDSNFSRDDITRRLAVNPEKVKVIYPGISPDFRPITDDLSSKTIRKKYQIENDFIVYTGIYKPRKNHAALLHAFRDLLSSGTDASLVLVGPLKEGEHYLRHLASELGIAKRVIFTGFVDDPELRILYSLATVYACPSLYEGFGFTILESMACGTPVVCSYETSLPEVAGNAALYADPQNFEEFAHALYSVFTDASLRRDLIDKGRKNVQRFSWAIAARETLKVYAQAVQSDSAFDPVGKKSEEEHGGRNYAGWGGA